MEHNIDSEFSELTSLDSDLILDPSFAEPKDGKELDSFKQAFYKDKQKAYRDSFPRDKESGRIVRFNEFNGNHSEIGKRAVAEFDKAFKEKFGDLIFSDYARDTITIMRNELLRLGDNLHNIKDFDPKTGEKRSADDKIRTIAYVINAKIHGNEKQAGMMNILERSIAKYPYFLADKGTLDSMKADLEQKLERVKQNIENRDFSAYENRDDKEAQANKHLENINKKIEKIERANSLIDAIGGIESEKNEVEALESQSKKNRQ